MNILFSYIKILKNTLIYFLIIFISFNLGCSRENTPENKKVSEKLISQQWIRDSYLSKNSNGEFENYETKSELQFLSNGNLLIKDVEATDFNGPGVPPPHGLVDTLIINGKWFYFETTNTLTLKVDDSVLEYSRYNYVNWKLSHLSDNSFEIEITESHDSIEIIKVNFKSKI